MFASNLKNIRISLKLTQKELGNKLNISSKTIGHWETGYSQPSLEFLVLLKVTLNVSYEDLLE